MKLQVESLSDLVAECLRIGTGTRGLIWYRGTPCAGHSLLPRILRDGRTFEEARRYESRLLSLFNQRSMAFWPAHAFASYPKNGWEIAFAMQHYNMPTRLLDWTENLFVAAYFALWPSTHDCCADADGECCPVIWALDPLAWNTSTRVLETPEVIPVASDSTDISTYAPMTPDRLTAKPMSSPIAIYGVSNSSRVVAQRGTFMVWGSDVKALETMVTGDQAMLWRIELRGNRTTLKQDLTVLGYGETMIFPELQSLADELVRRE